MHEPMMLDLDSFFWTKERILGFGALAFCILVPLVRWLAERFRKLVSQPSPWGPEIDRQLQSPESVPVCHHCFTPQPELPGWFCPDCGHAAGVANNLMPYVYLFSQGEVFRVGAYHRFAVNGLTVSGFILGSLVAYHVFAPVYWYRLIRNIRLLGRSRSPEPVESDPADGQRASS